MPDLRFSVSDGREIVDAFFGHDNDATAIAAVAAIGPAARHVLFAAKAQAAIAAAAARDFDLYTVDEHGN